MLILDVTKKKVLSVFEDIVEDGAVAPKEQMLHSIPECMTFRKCQGAGAPLFIVFPNTFEDVVGGGAVAPGEQCSFFCNIPKYMIFQKR